MEEKLKKLREEHQAELGEVERRAIEVAQEHFSKQIDQQARRKYSADNWLVNPNHVLQATDSGVYLGMEKITHNEASQLKRDAVVLKEMRLWQILQETLKQKAIDKSVMDSTNWEQVLAGKMMVHNLSIIKSIVEICAKFDLDKLSKSAKAFDKPETML